MELPRTNPMAPPPGARRATLWDAPVTGATAGLSGEEPAPVGRPDFCQAIAALAWRHGVAEPFEAAIDPRRRSSDRPGRPAVLRAARGAGLRCRRLRPGWDRLSRLRRDLPGVVSFIDGSCMLLLGVETDGTPVAVLADPRFPDGEPIVVDRLRFVARWTGELVLVRPARGPAASARPISARTLWRIALGEPRLLRDLGAASLVLGLTAVLPILFVELAVGRVIPHHARASLLILSLGLLAVVLADTVLAWARAMLLTRLSARMDARLATGLFDRLLGLPVPVVERLAAGEIARQFAGLGAIRDALAGPLMAAALDMAVAVAAVPLMAYLAPVLAAAVLGVAAAWLLVVLVAGRSLRRRAAAVADAEGRRTAFLMQSLAGIGVVKGLALAAARRRRWDQLTAAVGSARLALARGSDRLQALALPVERLAVTGSLALGIALSALRDAPAALAPLVAFYLLVQRLLAPLQSIGDLARARAEAGAALDALAALTSHRPEDDRASPAALGPLRGAVAFDAVRFRYPGGSGNALAGLSFALDPGTMLGIMGPNGAGKSTIGRLLQRLYPTYGGTIAIDGVDIREIGLAALRRAVAVVWQTSPIFAGTIRGTIAAARPETTFADLARAAWVAGADEFIERMPRGYETWLHDEAPALSAGQRQRLALARALIADPAVLILDEALSALDPDTEALVGSRLREARQGRTTIIVSHRLSSLGGVDAVMVMDTGAVRDIGSHAELIDRCDAYRTAWLREGGTLDDETAGDETLLALP